MSVIPEESVEPWEGATKMAKQEAKLDDKVSELLMIPKIEVPVDECVEASEKLVEEIVGHIWKLEQK